MVRGFVLSEHLVQIAVAILGGLVLMAVSYGFVASFSKGDFICKTTVGLKAWGAVDEVRCQTTSVAVPPRATSEEAAKIVADEMIGCWNQFGSGRIDSVIPYGLSSGVRSIISIPNQLEDLSYARKRCFVCAQIYPTDNEALVIEDLPIVLKSVYLNDQSYYQRLYPDSVRLERFGSKLDNRIESETIIVVYEEDREQGQPANGVVAYSLEEFRDRVEAAGFFGRDAIEGQYQDGGEDVSTSDFAICGLHYDLID